MKNRLNNAMRGHKRTPTREDDIEIVVGELFSCMVERGHSVTCYNRFGHHVSRKEFDSSSLKEYEGVKLRTFFSIKKRLAAMTSSFFGAILAAIGKYDVVHFHAEGPCAMLWILKLFGKRCIATINGGSVIIGTTT